MSREEAKEKEKAEMSDKIRLEMAIKESADVAAKVIAKHSPTHSSDVPATQPSDPWGAPAAKPQQGTFDPFANNKPANDSGFGADLWATTTNIPGPSQAAIQPATDPWGASTSSKQSSDVWGPSVPPLTPPTTNVDPWSSGEQTKQSNDPWSTGSAPQNADPWSNSAAPAVNVKLAGGDDNFDPFKPQKLEAQKSDPFHDFSQLSIQPSKAPLAAPLDLFSSDVMLPQAVNQTENTAAAAAVESGEDNNKAGAFLGDNAGLVNIDSLISKPSTNHSYITLNTPSIGASRNPFNQKGPSPSLNQMKTDVDNPFAGRSASVNTPNMMAPTAMGHPAMGTNLAMGGMMPVQQAYGFPGPVQNNANPFFTPQSVQPAPSNQPNQLLF